jgi:type VI protein secretion system component VasF
MWYTGRHFRHPVHPQNQVRPHPPTRANDMQRIPVPVIIAAAIIMALIAVALYGYTAGLWEQIAQ